MKYFIALIVLYFAAIWGMVYYLIENKELVKRIIKGDKDEDR